MRAFRNFVVIDWSGQAVARPKGLAVAHAASGHAAPTILQPEHGWSRGKLLDWLRAHADAQTDVLIGLDLSPALPFVDKGAYLPGWPDSPDNAKDLWRIVDEACRHEQHLSASSFLALEGIAPHFRQHGLPGALFPSGRGRLRQCESRQLGKGLSPSSCFNLVGAAQVGKSSLTGMRVLHQLERRIPVWPFDPVPASGPLIVEIYTTIAARAAKVRGGISKLRDAQSLDVALAHLGSAPHTALARYDDHATDAILTAAWLRVHAADAALWQPAALTPEIAQTEGWTFGVL